MSLSVSTITLIFVMNTKREQESFLKSSFIYLSITPSYCSPILLHNKCVDLATLNTQLYISKADIKTSLQHLAFIN